MFTRLRGRHPAGLIAIGVVSTLVLSGTAIAVTDTNFTYSTTQTGYLMVGPGDLVPADNFSAQNYVLDAGFASSGTEACFRAGVHLPQGARITTVRTSYISGTGYDLNFNLRRVNPVTGAENFLVARTVSDDSGVRTYALDAVPSNLGLVNNALHTHAYYVCVGGGTRFYGTRITYQYTSAGD